MRYFRDRKHPYPVSCPGPVSRTFHLIQYPWIFHQTPLALWKEWGYYVTRMGAVTDLTNLTLSPLFLFIYVERSFLLLLLFGYVQIVDDMDLKFTLRSSDIFLWHFSYYKPRYNKIPQMKPFDSLIIFPEVTLLYWYVAWYICHTPRLVLGENGGNHRCSKYLEWIAQVNTTMKNTLLLFKPTLIFNPQHLLILDYLKTLLCLLSNTLKSTKETKSSLHNPKIIIICLILNVGLDLSCQIKLTFKSKSKSEKTIWFDHSNRHIKLFPGCYFIM